MGKTFVKSSELTLQNGGYLTFGGKDGKPVSNKAFHAAQKHAEYVVKLAKLAKDKDFEGKEAVNINDLKLQVIEELEGSHDVQFVKGPKEVKRPTTEALKSEAFAFLEFQEKEGQSEKINAFLQQFKVINEFEEFGLFFEQDISKLNKIYTMKDIISAVTSVIDNLD